MVYGHSPYSDCVNSYYFLGNLQEIFRLVDRPGFKGVRPAGVNDTGSA